MLKAKRLDVVEQLDRLVMALSVYAYFGDPSFALLLLRVIVQMQLSRPQAHAHRTLPFFARLVTTLFFGSVFRNQLYGPGSGAVNPPSGVFLDFIGRGSSPSATAVLAQTASIYLLQLVCLLVAYETGHSPPPRDLPHPFFLVAPQQAAAPPASNASPSARALENLEAQPEDDSDGLLPTNDADKADWAPYTDFLSPLPTPRRRASPSTPSSWRHEGKRRASNTSLSLSATTSLLLPSERLPASGSLGEVEEPYLPSDAALDLADLSEAPILVIRPLPFVSRCFGIGVHARPAPQVEGARFSEWEAFWHGSGAGSRRELLGLGAR